MITVGTTGAACGVSRQSGQIKVTSNKILEFLLLDVQYDERSVAPKLQLICIF